MKTPFRRKLIHLAIGYAIAGASLTGLPPAMAVTTAPADAAAELAKPGDLQREWIELKNAVIQRPEDASLRERLGRLYLERGDGAAAEKELNRAIQLGRDDYALRLLLGRAWLQQGDYKRVFTDFDLSQASSDQEKAALAVLQGNARLASGRLDDAHDAFDSALALMPSYGPALIGLVEVALEQGDLGTAELEIARINASGDGAYGVDPAEVLRVEANLAFKRERFDQAEDAYLDALTQRPGSPVLLRGLASTQLQQGHLHDASATIDQLLSINQNNGDAIYLRSLVAFRQKDFAAAARYAGALTSPGSVAVEPLYIAGAASSFLGQYEQSREYLSRYLAVRPDSSAARRLLAVAMIETGAGDQAYAVLQPIKAAAEDDVGLSVLLGTAALQAGQAQEAIERLENAVALEPDDEGLRTRLAAARMLTGDRTRGLEEMEALAAKDSNLAQDGALEFARYRLAEGDLQGALDAAHRYRDANPDRPESWLIEGLVLLSQNDLENAEAAFQAALKAAPGDSDAQTGLAEIALRQGNAEMAREILTNAFDSDRSNIDGQLSLAQTEFAAGRGDQALERLQALVAANPDSVQARVALAGALFNEGRWSESERILDAAPDPDAIPIRYAAARVALAQARPLAAEALLQQVLEATPSNLDARLLLARAQARLGNTEAADAALTAASAQAPAAVPLLFERARIALLNPNTSTQGLQQAMRDVASVVEQADGNAPAVVQLRGLAMLRLDGHGEDGLKLLRSADQAMRNTDSTVMLANALADQGQVNEGIDVLNTWMSVHFDDVQALLARARLYVLSGDYSAAADDLSDALKQGADQPDLALVLAWTQALSGHLELAQETSRRASIDLAELDSGMALHTRALLAADQKDSAQALQLLQQAARSAGPQPPPRLRLDLARALVAAGRPVQATKELHTLLDSTPTFPERADAERLLRQLGG